ncbi:MAG: zinc-binding dehydrogenase [Proteobacteria bacterium]|nr:zinc-binding dehydrogenase [Pseudomonadota bacterium]
MADMRAARLVEPGKMSCEKTAILEPGPGQVVIRNDMAAICGSDLHQVFFGNLGASSFPTEPGWPGHEGVGEVVETNDDSLKVGDKVLTIPGAGFQRCFADYQTLPAHWSLKLPDYDGPIEDLLMAQQFGTTIYALRRGNMDFTGKTVAVLGQGSAGMFFAWLAKHYGAETVIVSDLSPARLAQSPIFGADIAIQGDAEGRAIREAVMDSTGGRGAHIVIEAVGHAETILQSIDIARPRGHLVFFGLPDTAQPVQFSYSKFFGKQLQAYAVVGAQAEEDLSSFHKALDWISRRQIDVTEMVSHRLSLEAIDKAMLLAHERDEDALKVTLTF